MENKFTPFTTLAEDAEAARSVLAKNATNNLSWGIDLLDDAFVCIGRNDVVIIAGESGKGKSETALSIGMFNASKGKRVLVLALEAHRHEFGMRILFKLLVKYFYLDEKRDRSAYPRYIEWFYGRQANLLEPYMKKALDEMKAFTNLQIRYVDDDYGIKEYERDVASVSADTDLIIVDHLHYFHLVEKDENKEYKTILKKISELARFHDTPVIVVSHIRKQNAHSNHPVPHKDDIHGSSDIFKIATKAIIMAPAREHLKTSTPNSVGTFFRLSKCRQDGSLDNFIAALTFNYSTNCYEPNYTIGKFTSEKGKYTFVREDRPHWARLIQGEI